MRQTRPGLWSIAILPFLLAVAACSGSGGGGGSSAPAADAPASRSENPLPSWNPSPISLGREMAKPIAAPSQAAVVGEWQDHRQAIAASCDA